MVVLHLTLNHTHAHTLSFDSWGCVVSALRVQCEGDRSVQVKELCSSKGIQIRKGKTVVVQQLRISILRLYLDITYPSTTTVYTHLDAIEREGIWIFQEDPLIQG